MFTSELQRLHLMSGIETTRLFTCWKFYLKSWHDGFHHWCTKENPAGIIFTFEKHDCVKPRCVVRLKVTQQPERCCAARRVVMWVTSACVFVFVFVFSLLCVCLSVCPRLVYICSSSITFRTVYRWILNLVHKLWQWQQQAYVALRL